METKPASSQSLVHPDPTKTTEHAAGRRVALTGVLAYIIAIALGLFSGWVDQVVNDPLLTALCVLAFSMFMGVWQQHRPWRWMLLVWIGVPLMLGYYHFVVHLSHNRGQVYGAFLQLLPGSAGAHGGHFMRQVIDHIFLQQDD